MPAVSAYITLDGYPVLDPGALAREVRKAEASGNVTGIDINRILGRANSFTHPRGFEPGRGFILMLRAQAAELDRTITTHRLKFVTGSAEVEFTKLVIINIEEVTGGSEANINAACLVELSDLRIFGDMTSINKTYNVIRPQENLGVFYSSSQDGADEYWEWDELVADIWTFMPASFGSLDTTYADLPSATYCPFDYAFQGVTAWSALKKVLDDTHHVLTLSRSGSFGIEAAYNATGDFAAARDTHKPYILSGSHDIDAPVSRIPETVRVFFPKRDYAWQESTDPYIITSKDHWRFNPLVSVDVATSTIDATITTIADTVAPVHHPRPGTYDEEGAANDTTLLNNLAAIVAANYIQAKRDADNEALYRYSGARSFSPDAELAAVCYRDFGDGIITDVRGLDRNQRPSNLTNRGFYGGGAPDSNSPSFTVPTFNNAPSLNFTAPNLWTERIQVAKLTADLEPGGVASAYPQWGLNGGFDITFDDSDLPHSVNVYDAAQLTLASGTLVFIWFHTQTGRWLVLAAAPPPKLYAHLELGTGTGSGGAINWDIVDDDNDLVDLGPGSGDESRVIFNSTGKYRITCHTCLGMSTSPEEPGWLIRLYLKKNGTNVTWSGAGHSTAGLATKSRVITGSSDTAASDQNLSFVTVIDLTATDYLTFVPTIGGSGSIAYNHGYLAIDRLE